LSNTLQTTAYYIRIIIIIISIMQVRFTSGEQWWRWRSERPRRSRDRVMTSSPPCCTCPYRRCRRGPRDLLQFPSCIRNSSQIVTDWHTYAPLFYHLKQESVRVTRYC